MNETGKRQHYVQQRYLKHFKCSSNKETKRHKYIHKFNKIEDKIEPEVKIANVAYHNHFYDISVENLIKEIIVDQNLVDSFNNLGKTFTDSILTYDVEPHFENIEKLISAFHSGNLVNGSAVDQLSKNNEKNIISYYCSQQYLRTEAFRRHLINFLLTTSNEEDAKILKENEDKQKLIHAYFILLELVKNQIQQIMNSSIWVLGQSDQSNLFYTSDNPISILRDVEKARNAFDSVNLISYPLTPNLILLMITNLASNKEKYKPIENKLIQLNEMEVEYFNGLQLINAYEFVFSPENNFEAAKTLIQEKSKLTNKELNYQFYTLR